MVNARPWRLASGSWRLAKTIRSTFRKRSLFYIIGELKTGEIYNLREGKEQVNQGGLWKNRRGNSYKEMVGLALSVQQ